MDENEKRKRLEKTINNPEISANLYRSAEELNKMFFDGSGIEEYEV